MLSPFRNQKNLSFIIILRLIWLTMDFMFIFGKKTRQTVEIQIALKKKIPLVHKIYIQTIHT